MKNQTNIKVRIPKALYELYKKENNAKTGKEVLREMLKTQLTGMLTESLEEEMAAMASNTADEKNLSKSLDKSPLVKQAMGRINSTNELDGSLETLISNLGLQNMPKSSILTAIKKALEDLAPKTNVISTGEKALNEGTNKVARKKKK